MHTLTFSSGKQLFAEFHAESLEAERQPEGLLISAQGEMVRQDTQLAENYLQPPGRPCHVRLAEGDAEVLSGQFDVTFFTFEAAELVVKLG